MADTAQTTIEALLAAADAACGAEYSAVLYGSLARGDYREGRSDLNLLLVVRGLTGQRLRALAPALAAFPANGLTPPLLFDADEWARAADVFPVELADMRLDYRVLRGVDPVAGQEVVPRDLRRALEHEWRGKLLRLRQEFAADLGRPEALGAAAAASAAPVRVLLRGTMVLAGRRPPEEDAALARAAGELCGFPPGPVATVLAQRRQPAWRLEAGPFEEYLDALARATRFVDTFHGGES